MLHAGARARLSSPAVPARDQFGRSVSPVRSLRTRRNRGLRRRLQRRAVTPYKPSAASMRAKASKNPDPESALFTPWSRRIGPPLSACAAMASPRPLSYGGNERTPCARGEADRVQAPRLTSPPRIRTPVRSRAHSYCRSCSTSRVDGDNCAIRGNKTERSWALLVSPAAADRLVARRSRGILACLATKPIESRIGTPRRRRGRPSRPAHNRAQTERGEHYAYSHRPFRNPVFGR
jgi:hypothetical protein